MKLRRCRNQNAECRSSYWLAGVIYLLSVSCVVAAPTAPSNLRVEDRLDPIGMGDQTPEFSWFAQHEQPNKVQSAYQILVASSLDKLEEGKTDKWDSGKIDSSNVAFVSYKGNALNSREVSYWKV